MYDVPPDPLRPHHCPMWAKVLVCACMAFVGVYAFKGVIW